MLRAIINDQGIIIQVKEVHPNGQESDVKYDEQETKNIIGSRLYTPNGCCWRKTPQGWVCKPEYC